jgi:hypothetical protein
MLGKATLAAGVMAALPVSVLLAQDKPRPKSDPGSSLTGAVPRPPLESTSSAHEKELQPPPVMRVCANPQDWNQCSTWTWVNDHYDGWREWGAIATMTVESFTRDSVVINRTDTGPSGQGHPGDGFTMAYRGTVSADGNSILDGASVTNRGKAGVFRAYWGPALASHPAMSPYKGPTASVNNPGAALLMGILGIGPDGSRKPTDITERISNLQSQLDAARDACTHINPRFDNGQACQANKDHVEYELSEAYAELNEEIQALQEAQPKLTTECKAGNKDSCRKLEQVNARVDKDVNFKVSSVFH